KSYSRCFLEGIGTKAERFGRYQARESTRLRPPNSHTRLLCARTLSAATGTRTLIFPGENDPKGRPSRGGDNRATGRSLLNTRHSVYLVPSTSPMQGQSRSQPRGHEPGPELVEG